MGSGIELEGDVASASGSTFTLQVNGNRSSTPVSVDASAASFQCNGAHSSDNGKGKSGGGDDGATCNAASLSAGDKVHVRGTLTTCSTTAAQVVATEVMIQKGGGD